MSEQTMERSTHGHGDDLHGWLLEQQRSKATRLVLRLRHLSGLEHVVRDLVIDPTASIDGLAEGLLSRARSAAQHHEGRAAFSVQALRDLDPIDLFFFALNAAPSPVLARREEAPSVELTALLMRHTEASARLSLGHTAGIVDQYKQLLEEREERVRYLERRIADMAQAQEDILTLRFEREETARKGAREDKRDEFLKDKLDLLLPVVMAKFAPGAAVPGVDTLATQMIGSFLGSLAPTQMEQIMNVLDAHQKILMGSIYEQYFKRDAAKKKTSETTSDAPANASTSEGASHAAA